MRSQAPPGRRRLLAPADRLPGGARAVHCTFQISCIYIVYIFTPHAAWQVLPVKAMGVGQMNSATFPDLIVSGLNVFVFVTNPNSYFPTIILILIPTGSRAEAVAGRQ